MDVFWLDGAVADIQEIVAYIEADNPAAAQHVAAPCTMRRSDLALTPGSGVVAEGGALASSSCLLFPSSSRTGYAPIGLR
jgi:plasmid stabilization system protein ParE